MDEKVAQSEEFEEFATSYRTPLRWYASYLCGTEHAADDLAQETLIILHRRWNAIAPDARRAYARTVVRRLAIHWSRNNQHLYEIPFGTIPEASPLDAEPGTPDAITDRMLIMSALSRTPRRQREVVYLRYWVGLPTETIAQSLHVPAGTVRSDLTRATARLAAILRELFAIA